MLIVYLLQNCTDRPRSPLFLIEEERISKKCDFCTFSQPTSFFLNNHHNDSDGDRINDEYPSDVYRGLSVFDLW